MNVQPVRASKTAVAVACSVVALLSLGGSVQAQVSEFALFGAGGVNLGQSAKVRGGAVGSNANVSVAAFNEVHGLYGGGSLLPPAGGSGTYDGPVVFNGSASIGAVVNGPVNVGGSVSITGTITGNVTAGGTVYGNFPSTLTGNVRAGGNFIQDSGTLNGNVVTNGFANISGTVNGSITYGTAYQKNLGGSVTGPVVQAAPTPVTPTPFVARTLPAATSFTSGGANVISSSDVHLSPGKYGVLSLASLNDLYLTGGDYYFDSFDFDGFDIHLENVSASTPLRVYVTGDLTSGSLADMTINGMTLAQLANTQPGLADSIRWETHGDFIDKGGNEWAGTIFAPDGNVELGNSTAVVGKIYASGTITAGTAATLNVVPEPATMAALVLMAAPLMRRRR